MTILYLAEQGARLRREQKLFLLEGPDGSVARVKAGTVEGIVIVGNVNLTTPILQTLLYEGIDCAFLSVRGRYYGRLVSTESGLGELRRAQAMAVATPSRSLELARIIVRAKLRNQLQLLVKVGPPGAQGAARIQDALVRLDTMTRVEEVRGVEGLSAAAYFGAWPTLLPPEWAFSRRVQRANRDPVNSLLNFGYAVLLSRVDAAVRTVGLDPYLGFLHAERQSRPNLALDLMEQFRPAVVDLVVLRGIRKGLLHLDGFDFAPGPVPLLNADTRARFIRLLEEQLATRILYRPTNQRLAVQRVIEYDARRLAQHLLSNGKAPYEGYLVR